MRVVVTVFRDCEKGPDRQKSRKQARSRARLAKPSSGEFQPYCSSSLVRFSTALHNELRKDTPGS